MRRNLDDPSWNLCPSALAMSAIVVSALSLGFSAPGALHAVRAPMSIFASAAPEPEVEDSKASDIFTLQERDDGWDDVRGSIKLAIKDRTKGWNELKDNYVAPAARWSKAIANVTAETASDLNIPQIDASEINVPKLDVSGLSIPKLDGIVAPTLPTPSKEQAIKAVAGLLDAVADVRGVAKPEPVKPEPKPVPAKPLLAKLLFNPVVFFGVPAVTIAALAGALVMDQVF